MYQELFAFLSDTWRINLGVLANKLKNNLRQWNASINHITWFALLPPFSAKLYTLSRFITTYVSVVQESQHYPSILPSGNPRYEATLSTMLKLAWVDVPLTNAQRSIWQMKERWYYHAHIQNVLSSAKNNILDLWPIWIMWICTI